MRCIGPFSIQSPIYNVNMNYCMPFRNIMESSMVLTTINWSVNRKKTYMMRELADSHVIIHLVYRNLKKKKNPYVLAETLRP